jgi:formylglycine-generating enzyme required for sulfatase activity
MPMTVQAEYTYDLFVSYAEADRAWVEGYLIDALTQAGVKCHSEAAFALGAPRLIEFERAVQESQRTLLVLSPAYLAAEGFTQFTHLLAQSYGLETATWPVIPLILQPMKLPPRLAMLTALDATDAKAWPTVIQHLCEEFHRPVPGPPPRPPCPYPGMVPFRAEDARFFYGREAEIQGLLRHLRHHNSLFVIGPSGSGKSSLVFAGLVPKLHERQPGQWLVRSMRPGSDPMWSLREALDGSPASASPTVKAYRELVASALAQHPPVLRLLLVVDQFEELFTQAEKPQQAAFITALKSLQGVETCTLLLAMRADFYPDLMNSDLWPVDVGQRLEIAPLRGGALRQAIQQPAADVGVHLEASLLERLLADAADEPGVLPLVQETMVLLWGDMQRRLLPLSAYERLGGAPSTGSPVPASQVQAGQAGRSGLAVAIAEKADATLAELPPDEQAIARRIFLRLVQFGEGRADTRRQQLVSALRAASDEPLLLDQTLHHLAGNRLVTLSGEEGDTDRQVDLAHEALINGWPRLGEWLWERREAEQTRRRLEAKAAEWVRLKGVGGLLDGVGLREAERWLESSDATDLGYSETLPALVEASRAAIEEAKREKEATHQRELEQAQALAQEQQRRAEAQVRAARRLRWLVALLVLLALVAPGIWSYRQVLRLMARGEMVPLPGGHVTIGSAEEVAFADETPAWSTDVASFKIERFEVSNRQYRLCVRAGTCTKPQDTSSYERDDLLDYPVVTVTAFQAAAYCRWLGRRLPSEVEWEWAARGAEGHNWPWGDPPPDEERLNVSFDPSGGENLQPVDSHRNGATPDGVFNLAGNVMEWTASLYQPYPYDPLEALWADGNPNTAPDNLVIRGGSFMTGLQQARPTARLEAKPSAQREDLGFRCAQSVP